MPQFPRDNAQFIVSGCWRCSQCQQRLVCHLIRCFTAGLAALDQRKFILLLTLFPVEINARKQPPYTVLRAISVAVGCIMSC